MIESAVDVQAKGFAVGWGSESGMYARWASDCCIWQNVARVCHELWLDCDNHGEHTIAP